MPWKDGYTTSDEKSLADHEVKWPDDNQCACILVVDLSLASGPQGITPSDLSTAAAQFAMQVGISSILDVLQRFAMTATFAVPAVMADIYTEIVKAIVDNGHEVAALGFKHEDVSQLDKKEERQRIEAATEILLRSSGQQPSGFYTLPRQSDPFAVGAISPNTMTLLIDAGYTYMGNGLADDIPYYWVTDAQTNRCILTLPYSYHFNDQYFLMYPPPGLGSGLENPKPFLTNCKLEFDAQYKRGRYFSMTLHPYIIGFGHRLRILETVLSHIRDFPAVWNPTAAQCAKYWQAQYPASSTLHLEPSIWQDYPNSLS
ncbi:MAG: polysaccharide deacetylase family protein [bacterium]|nr:polysaccharide deacetylase family protein [bacterium]